MEWLTSDTVFYTGTIISAAALLLAVGNFVIFTIKRTNLNARMDAEYGKRVKRSERQKAQANDKEEYNDG